MARWATTRQLAEHVTGAVKVILKPGSGAGARRLLLVAYFFPPQPKGGAHRLGHVADHLAESGWEVTVVTPAQYPAPKPRPRAAADAHAARPRAFARLAGQARALAKQVPLLKRAALAGLDLLQLPRTLRNFPDATSWWIKPATRHIDALLRQSRYDAIVTTHSPCSGHLIGAAIARRHAIPWLADYQDLWTGNGSSTKSPTRKYLEKRLERSALRSAAAITCCKASFIERLTDVVESATPASQITVIPFAVDMEAWEGIPDTPPHEFRIAFVGNLYPKHITPDLLLRALAALQRDGTPAGAAVHFHYYGSSGIVVREAAARYGVRNVTDHGLVPRRAALEAERAAALLVSIVNPDSDAPNPRQWFPSKLFEYAGSKRRILAIAPEGSIIRQFIDESGLGYVAHDETSCASAIRSAYEEFMAGRARVTPLPAWRYATPSEVAQRFAVVLNRIVANGAAATSPLAQTPLPESAKQSLGSSLTTAR